MGKLIIRLPGDRDYTGVLYLLGDEGNVVAGPFAVAGRAVDAVAATHGNKSRSPLVPYGDTPCGTYELTRLISLSGATAAQKREWGRAGVAVLEPKSGDAALADAAGRFAICIHGGEPSPDGRLRATNGSLRLTNEDQQDLMKALRGNEGMECECLSGNRSRGSRRVSTDEVLDCGDPPIFPQAGRLR
jgi:hypothetical protein